MDIEKIKDLLKGKKIVEVETDEGYSNLILTVDDSSKIEIRYNDWAEEITVGLL